MTEIRDVSATATIRRRKPLSFVVEREFDGFESVG